MNHGCSRYSSEGCPKTRPYWSLRGGQRPSARPFSWPETLPWLHRWPGDPEVDARRKAVGRRIPGLARRSSQAKEATVLREYQKLQTWFFIRRTGEDSVDEAEGSLVDLPTLHLHPGLPSQTPGSRLDLGKGVKAEGTRGSPGWPSWSPRMNKGRLAQAARRQHCRLPWMRPVLSCIRGRKTDRPPLWAVRCNRGDKGTGDPERLYPTKQ